ncbi:hypothetical protein ES705_48460 [subsurface metagenome]
MIPSFFIFFANLKVLTSLPIITGIIGVSLLDKVLKPSSFKPLMKKWMFFCNAFILSLSFRMISKALIATAVETGGSAALNINALEAYLKKVIISLSPAIYPPIDGIALLNVPM